MSRALPLLAAGALALAGCGDGELPMPDTSKTVPIVPETYQRRDLDAWVGLSTGAPPQEKVAQAFALAALEKDPIRAAPILLRLLQDDAPSVRLAAVIAAGRLAPPSPRLAAVLTDLLASDEEPLRRHAREAVGAFGAHAVAPLGDALGDERLVVRWGALQALGRVGAPAERLAPQVERLARESDDATVRRQARFTLARLGPDGANRCARFLRSEVAAERDSAAAALAHGGADAVPPLLALVAAPDEVPAAVAAGVLEEIAARRALGATASRAAQVLAEALRRAGPVRFNALAALRAIGPDAREPVAAIAAEADDELRALLVPLLEGWTAAPR